METVVGQVRPRCPESGEFQQNLKKEPIPVKMLEVTKPKYNHTGRGVKFFKL